MLYCAKIFNFHYPIIVTSNAVNKAKFPLAILAILIVFFIFLKLAFYLKLTQVHYKSLGRTRVYNAVAEREKQSIATKYQESNASGIESTCVLQKLLQIKFHVSYCIGSYTHWYPSNNEIHLSFYTQMKDCVKKNEITSICRQIISVSKVNRDHWICAFKQPNQNLTHTSPWQAASVFLLLLLFLLI